jgi:hypothetical protein
MNAGELIELLQRFPSDQKVAIVILQRSEYHDVIPMDYNRYAPVEARRINQTDPQNPIVEILVRRTDFH